MIVVSVFNCRLGICFWGEVFEAALGPDRSGPDRSGAEGGETGWISKRGGGRAVHRSGRFR
jgi:hypothetical protein